MVVLSAQGAAFGFSTIALSAGAQLSQHLPTIIPRLYRYQFDPTPKIQNSMTSIWHALVPETQKTVSSDILRPKSLYIYIYIYTHTHTHTHTRVRAYNSIPCSMVWYSTVQYNTAQHNPTQHNTVQ
jgi:hypothetical protein